MQQLLEMKVRIKDRMEYESLPNTLKYKNYPEIVHIYYYKVLIYRSII